MSLWDEIGIKKRDKKGVLVSFFLDIYIIFKGTYTQPTEFSPNAKKVSTNNSIPN